MTKYASYLPEGAPESPFERLCWIMDRLLGEGGCPWDREQTHDTLKQYLIEEAYEVYDSIEDGNFEHLEEELGDVALQVVFHSKLAERERHFSMDDVLLGVCNKLVRRHPHVFGETRVAGSEQVLENWEEIKKRERSDKKRTNRFWPGFRVISPRFKRRIACSRRPAEWALIGRIRKTPWRRCARSSRS